MIRTRKPLAPIGKRGRQLLAIRDEVWPTVLWRAGNKCEGCDQPATKVILTYAHAFGRNGTGCGLGHFSHVPELAFALCLRRGVRFGSCHTRYDDYLDAPLRVRLERLALTRFQKTYGGTVNEMHAPKDNIRRLVRELEAAGIAPGGGRLPEPTAK